MKSNTDVIVFSLLWSLFASAMPVLILVFIRNFGRSEELLEDMILQLQCHFGVGVVAITLGANSLWSWWGEGKYSVMKSNTDVIAFLCCLFTLITLILGCLFIRNLVTITYSAIGGRSEELLEDMVLQLQCRFGVGALAGVCLAGTLIEVLLGMRVQVECSLAIMVVAFIWYKKVTMASATDSKPPSTTRRSTAEQTMMTV
jgi:hypothetical protein